MIGGAIELSNWSKATENVRIWFDKHCFFLHGASLANIKDLADLGLSQEKV